MSMVRLQNSSPDKNNETDNSNFKALIKITKKPTHSDLNTLHHWGLATLLNKHATGLPQPTNAKTQNTHPHTKKQGEKATSPSIIHTPEETTGRRSWNHWMEAHHLERQTDPAWTWLHNSRISQRHIGLGRMDTENMGGGWTWECTNELCFEWTLFWYLWEDFGILFASNTYTLHRLCWVFNLSSNFASMDIINVRVTVDICLGGWFNLFCIHWKYWGTFQFYVFRALLPHQTCRSKIWRTSSSS